MIKESKLYIIFVFYFLVISISVLLRIIFVPKVGMPMSKTVCINAMHIQNFVYCKESLGEIIFNIFQLKR